MGSDQPFVVAARTALTVPNTASRRKCYARANGRSNLQRHFCHDLGLFPKFRLDEAAKETFEFFDVERHLPSGPWPRRAPCVRPNDSLGVGAVNAETASTAQEIALQRAWRSDVLLLDLIEGSCQTRLGACAGTCFPYGHDPVEATKAAKHFLLRQQKW